MIEFLLLLLAHVLADFYWQPTAWVIDKREKSFRSKYLYAHTGIVIITSYVLLGHFQNPFPAIILGLVHGIIDIFKLEFDKKGTTSWFIGDQIAHLVSIILTAIILTSSFSIELDHLKEWFNNARIIVILTGTFLVLSPVSFLVGMLTKPWRDELDKLLPHADDNLANAGRWIGMSERLLIFVFVLLSQYSAIGFLIAAKSLLRYNDKAAAEQIPPTYISKKSEYILVGTLMSYTAAICTALATRLFY
ncbi:DUF3307 domain-containing protein [Dyadobacter sp. CY356]|uniref:DUF3307 domain-containing protein n=1 Tax=Dyadobacter sp. CY356 TaxID=2906442 RepID=UPI001F428DC4|nr:DUF3307 domain-containing protein [Dyadobacter sp. CY356]MCF0054466.1 DUF3307 domain-containing protein [Dyadobacter sp. CY356]